MRWHGFPPVHLKVRKVIAVRRDPRGSRANLAPMALRGFKAPRVKALSKVWLKAVIRDYKDHKEL